jgi:hypothetical protein
VTPDRSKSPEDDRVVPFRPRARSTRRPSWQQPPAPPARGFAKYEGGDGDDNYRHRMVVNLAALAFTIALTIAGVWLAMQLAELRKKEDCILSGRHNCNPIDVDALKR